MRVHGEHIVQTHPEVLYVHPMLPEPPKLLDMGILEEDDTWDDEDEPFRTRANTWPSIVDNEYPKVELDRNRKRSHAVCGWTDLGKEAKRGKLEMDYDSEFEQVQGEQIIEIKNDTQKLEELSPDYQLAWVEVAPGVVVRLLLPTPLLVKDGSASRDNYCDASCQTDDDLSIRTPCFARAYQEENREK